GDDHILLAVDDEQIAVLVDISEIAGLPAHFGEGFARRLLVGPIAGGNAVAADHHLADLATGNFVAVVIQDENAAAADRKAGRAAFARADGRLHHRLAAAFRRAVDLRDARAA